MFMIQVLTLADLSKEPVMKWDQSEDFDSDEIVFWCPDSLSDSFSSFPVYIQLKEHPMSDETN
jgi:hypothetical protein